FFFLSPTPPSDRDTLSLHDALPICAPRPTFPCIGLRERPSNLNKVNTMKRIISGLGIAFTMLALPAFAQTDKPNVSVPSANNSGDRKSTRLNSSHEWISYAVFCLKK